MPPFGPNPFWQTRHIFPSKANYIRFWPQCPWWLFLKVVGGCSILIVATTLDPINKFQIFYFSYRNINLGKQFIGMCPWSEPKIPHYIVLCINLVDSFHFNCNLLILIHQEDASKLLFIVSVIQLKKVLPKHIVVFLKPNELVYIWWILTWLVDSNGIWISLVEERSKKDKESWVLFMLRDNTTGLVGSSTIEGFLQTNLWMSW